MMNSTSEYLAFYDTRRNETYGESYTNRGPENHSNYRQLKRFIDTYELESKRCLEIGSSGGAFQDMVNDYYGTDVSPELGVQYHKPYRVCNGEQYPFDDGFFDAIWTIATFEHIPHLDTAMLEINRLLKPGGLVYFAPAWQCRTWAAEGYEVRPYADFPLTGKLVKASIPIRDSLLWRSIGLFPKRFFRHLAYLAGVRDSQMRYRKLDANYDVFWTSDSDACNSIDPHDAILWFESNGFRCLSHPMHLRAFLVRTGPIILQKESQ